jgi:hypothetical protein
VYVRLDTGTLFHHPKTQIPLMRRIHLIERNF